MPRPFNSNSRKGSNPCYLAAESTKKKTHDNYKEIFAILEVRTPPTLQDSLDDTISVAPRRGAKIVELKLNNERFKKGGDININLFGDFWSRWDLAIKRCDTEKSWKHLELSRRQCANFARCPSLNFTVDFILHFMKTILQSELQNVSSTKVM